MCIRDRVIHHAKRAVIDWCAATAQGSVIMPAAGLIKAFTEDVGRGEARLFPSGIPATLRAAAIINGAASHTVEFDDIFRDALYHPGASVISTALAAAEAEALSGEEFLRAIIVGYEISTRIALVMGRAHYKYWHSTATNGSFGAAAAAASVFKLDRDQFANAIALAGTMAAGLQPRVLWRVLLFQVLPHRRLATCTLVIQQLATAVCRYECPDSLLWFLHRDCFQTN